MRAEPRLRPAAQPRPREVDGAHVGTREARGEQLRLGGKVRHVRHVTPQLSSREVVLQNLWRWGRAFIVLATTRKECKRWSKKKTRKKYQAPNKGLSSTAKHAPRRAPERSVGRSPPGV